MNLTKKEIDQIIIKKFEIKPDDILPSIGSIKTNRITLHKLFTDIGYTYGAEIGVAWGKHANQMLTTIPELKLLLVDPWIAFGGNSNRRMEKIFQSCKKRIDNKNAQYIRIPSIEAVKKIKDESLDFVYIDGLHDFDSIMLDIIMWAPKVRKNGIISGHDYCNKYQFGIIEAVKTYTYAHNIHQWYITGQPTRPRDMPSFFWVK